MPRLLPINVAKLLAHQGIESARLEFKASWDPQRTGLQVLKTICAYANDLQNLNGGYIAIGVAEVDGQAQLPPRGLDPSELDSIQRWIRGRCESIDPVYQPVLSPEVIDDRHVLMVWAPGSDTRPHQVPVSFAKGAERAYFVRHASETVRAKGATLTQLMQLTARVPFDDRRAHGVPIESIREARVRELLSDVGSDLIHERDAVEVYRRMRICSPANGGVNPRNVGLLFFSDDPEEWFQGARIEVAQFAGDSSGNVIEEKVFRGPLHHQLRNVIQYLHGLSTRHLEKLADRPEVKGWVSYPLPALEEAVVNAVYHRGYDASPEPTKVYLFPDRIEVISYPGPMPGIEAVHLEPGGRIPPVPARNRRIGELLKELRLAEGRGTGVPKMHRVMQENGSPHPRFDFDDARSYFRATLPAHPEYVAIAALRDAAHLNAVGDRAGALERLEQAHAELPDSETVASALISDLGRVREIDRARRVFENFMEHRRAPGGSKAIVAMSNALLDAGMKREARAALDRLPSALAAQEAFDAAIAERRADRQDRAHALFESAGELIFTDVRALHELAQTKLALARKLRAPGDDSLQHDARVRLLREARQMLERVLQMDAPPTRRAWAWFDLGRVLTSLDEPASEARRAFEEALALLPAEPRFRRALASTRKG